VNSSGNSKAIEHLNLLFEETPWAFEPFDLIGVVKSSKNEQALEELVVMFSTKHAMCNFHAGLLQDIVESKISSEEGSLTETSKMIQQAIHNNFWRLPSD